MTLKPGDMCEVIGCENQGAEGAWYVGQVGVIAEGPRLAQNSVTEEVATVYIIEGLTLNPAYEPPGPGQFLAFREEHLRKINDGDEKEVTSWEDGVWQPKELVRVE